MYKDNILGILAGIFAGFIWGAWIPITKYGISNSLNVNDVIFLRFVTAAIISLPLLFKYGFLVDKISWFKTTSLTMSSGIGYVVIASIGFTFTPASYGSIIPVCMTFFSAILAAKLYKQKLKINTAISLLLILLGFALFTTQLENQIDVSIFGILLFIVAGLFFATYNVSVGYWAVKPIHAVSLVSFYSAVIFLPYYIFANKRLLNGDINEIVFQIIFQGILVSFIALLLFSYSSSKLGAPKSALFAILMPVNGVVLSAIFLKEEISTIVALAMTIMFVGMFVGLMRSKK